MSEIGGPRRVLVRSPTYVLRAVVGLALIIVAVTLLLVFENALLGLHDDIVTWQASWPGWLGSGIQVVFAVGFVLSVIGTNVYLLMRRKFRRWFVVNFAGIMGAVLTGLLAAVVLAHASSPALRDILATAPGRAGSLGNAGLASLVAVVTVAVPWIKRPLRPWVNGLLITAVGLSFLGAALAVITLPLDIGAGILAGALVALLVKTPDPTPTPDEVAAVLAASGVRTTGIAKATVEARGSVPWFVNAVGGERLFVKTLGADQRAADLLYRLYRWLRLRKAGDRQPFGSLRRAVEHEALLSLAAASRGVRTPALMAVAEIGADGMLIAYRRIEGRRLNAAGDGEVTDDLLDTIWGAVQELHEHGIAHRDLRLANVLVAGDDEPWLIGFGFAELAAGDDLLARDVAELVASTTAIVGEERAVAAAVRTLGPDRVADAVPWIQPLAVSSATRAQIAGAGGFQQLRDTMCGAVGLTEVRYERIERVSPRTILLLASIAVTFYVLAPQLSAASTVIDEARQARLGWVGVAVVASALTYVAAAIGMVGAVPVRLPLGPVIAAQVASSFANRVTPAKVGGMAANVRFLQKKGMKTAVAVSAVGLNTVAGFVTHVGMLAAALTLAGQERRVDLPLPAPRTALLVGVVLLVASAVAVATPAGRKLLTRNLLPALGAAASSLVTIARTPLKLAELLLGSVLLTLSYATAMMASLYAFGSDIGLASGVAVYLAGSAVAMAAPTPGGVGATEAALIAGYTAVGVDAPVAVAAVLLFRLVTFWLPILPGWWALIRLQKDGQL